MPRSTNKAHEIPYFGDLSWANLLDWLVTLCLGSILVLTANGLGGVRPETQVFVLPLYILLLLLHGLSLAAARQGGIKLSPVPLFFIPFLAWVFMSVSYWTPTPWRGSYELVHFLMAFIFGWVAVNNVRTRAHLWGLALIALLPLAKAIFVGYYQFFQDSYMIADSMIGYPLELNPRYHGQATGLFADPGSFAGFLLILLPCFIIATFVPRLPMVVRVLSFYLAIVLVVAVTLTQTYWAAVAVVVVMALVPWFCFDRMRRRFFCSLFCVASASAVFLMMYLFNPLFERGFANALTSKGEGVRLVLWKELLSSFQQNPVLGSGAGSFSMMMESSPDLALARLPLTPHNDYLLILSEYGAVGACLLFLPLAYVFYRAFRQWGKEPLKLKSRTGFVMPTQKFFLSLGICSGIALMLCAALHFPLSVPTLLLYGVLVFSILVKASFRRTVKLPGSRVYGLLYIVVCTCLGAVFWAHSAPVAESHGLELQARQRLEALVEGRISVSGNFRFVDQVIELYEDALIADPENADAWVGLSMAICQLHYRSPADFEKTGGRAVEAALQAYKGCPEYWLASAQLGVAYALSGEVEEARAALKRALEIAPHSSNAHYYYAAFLGTEPSQRDEAIRQVRRALEIDPNNVTARRLEQKLLIL